MITQTMNKYWANGITPISHQLSKQLKQEFNKLDYKDIDDKPFLAKILRLVHAKPKDAYQSDLFHFICN